MTQDNAKTDQNSDKKETKSSILDKVLGTKEDKESKFGQEGCETMVKELTESLQRLQAEFENYQKRNAKQNEEFKVFANAKLIEDLLPILDSLEQGMQHSKDLVLVHDQIYGILKKKGLEKIQVKKGVLFNHEEMDCLMQECDKTLPADAVVNVLMSGYKLNGKILRPARASVNVLQKEEIKNENKTDGENMADKNKEKSKEKKTEEDKEKNEHEGMTKCDFEIKIMESD